MMGWNTFDLVLLRGFLPICLLGASITRYNGFSFIYLIMLLICPLVRYSLDRQRKSVEIFLIVLLTLSAAFSASIALFHIPVFVQSGESLSNCSNLSTSVFHQVGMTNFRAVPFHRVLRLIMPDYMIFIAALGLFIYYRYRTNHIKRMGTDNVVIHKISNDSNIDSEMNTPDSLSAGPSRHIVTDEEIMSTTFAQQNMSAVEAENLDDQHNNHNRKIYEVPNLLQETFGIDRIHKKIWRAWAMQSLFVFFNVVVTGIAGIMSPSILSSVYLFSFIGVCTYWASGNKVITTNFAYMRIFLLMYSAIHVCLLYVVQIEFMQYFLPNGQFSSRLLGLYYFFNTSCEARGEFTFETQRPIDYLLPCIILVVYYLYATETRRWFEKGRESVPRVRSIKEDPKMSSIRQPNDKDPELQHLIPDKEVSSTLTTTASKRPDYKAVSHSVAMVQMKPNVDNNAVEKADESNFIIAEAGDNESPHMIPPSHTERPLLLSLISTAIRNSYVFTFIAMMAWSVTYKSWLSFILLIFACILWMMPDSRRACLYMSPLIVFYAIALITIQYIYGFNLSELPTKMKNDVDLAEIGLNWYSDNPTRPLAVMIGFLVVFWLTLRLFMNERGLHAHRERSQSYSESRIDQESTTDSEAYFGDVDNVIYKKIISFLNAICEKYWILVCCFAMLFVSIQGPVVVFRIVYMLMLVYFQLTFMFSYTFWRKQMYVFWWVVIVYSVIVLFVIYTFQFQEFPYIWKNKTGLSDDILRDIGLEHYKTAALFEGLLTPVVFLVVIIVQVRYFHRPFLRLSAMNRFQFGDSRETGGNQANFNASASTSSTSNVSAFMEDVNSMFHTVVEKLTRFFDVMYRKFWRFFEVHFTKIVVFLIMYACINDVDASNILLIITIVWCFPFHRLHQVLVTFAFLWCSILVLMKMVYQLKTVQFKWLANCTNMNMSSMNNIDNAQWIGLKRVDNFEDYISRWVAVMVSCSIWFAIRYHQRQYYRLPDAERPPRGVIFSEINVDKLNDSLFNLLKYCFNYAFYKLGLELCFIVTVIVACLRVDVYSVVYLLLLLLFLCTPRDVSHRLWLPYMLFLGALLPLQYSICVGLPPVLCLNYPFNVSIITTPLQQWLFLPSYIKPPVAKKLMADFFQFIFVALQYQVFKMENSPEVHTFGGGKNRPILSNELPKAIDKDFVSTKESYVDYLKHAVFYWSYWLSLAIVFTTGVFWITLFCLGYMILAFIYLWMGQNIMLRKRSNLIASWNVIIYYNFFVILAKCSLQLMGCAYMESMINQSLCWIVQLFGVQCINPMSWNILSTAILDLDPKKCSGVDSGLHWDVTCFLFIILQRKIFMTKSFCHVVLDLNVQNRFASRGAYLINRKMMDSIREQQQREEETLVKLRVKIEKIIQRQAQHGKPELNEHYLVVRSGEGYLFDGDPSEDDDDLETTNVKPEKKPLSSSDDILTPSVDLMSDTKDSSQSASEGTLTQESPVIASSNLPIPGKSNLNTIREHSIVGGESQRKGSDVGSKQNLDNNKETASDSSEEDDANPNQSTNQINPLQLINKAMEQGPRLAVREFKRTLSESKDSGITHRRSSVHLGSRLESMSEQDELNSLPETYNTPQPHASESTTEDSFYSANLPQEPVDQYHFGSDVTRHSPIPSESETCHPPTDKETCEQYLPDKDDIYKDIDKSYRSETCWSKFKASMQVIYYFFKSTMQSIIVLLNGWTKEYRRISRTLDHEKRLVKRRVISNIRSDVEVKIEIESIVMEIVGNHSRNAIPSKKQEDEKKEQEFRRNRSGFFLLMIAIGNVAVIYSEFICYFLLILNHMLSANLFSLPYPLMVFLWAMLSVPRPSKNFWIALITYTEIVIVLKYIFQFKFIEFNTVSDNSKTMFIPLIIGIEKAHNYAILDLIQLLFIFLHRGYLKNNGLWRDHSEFAQDLEIADKDQDGKDRQLSDETYPQQSSWSCNPVYKMKRFYAKMTNPKFNKKVDVYVYMFLCEFIAFLIIIFGYESFGPGTDAADNALDFIKTNKMPVPFVIMLITQFIFFIIDRALFLRKQVKGKFIFQLFHVFLIHAWLFFALPHITQKRFNSQVAPQLLYFVKCIYFALSAYQMKSGYPIRILGNFLTRKFNYINLFMFKGYMIVPFLYELRNVMDWMWTDTSVALYHWMEVEDVFCKIFVLKCWRRSELEYPTLRGHTRRLASKYSVGGLLLAFFFICFWGPLTLSSFIGTTFVQNNPLQCHSSLSLGGYSPLFVFTSRELNVQSLSRVNFEKMKDSYKNNVQATSYLQSFEASDAVEILIDEVSGSSWTISPPSLADLQEQLKNDKILNVNMQIVCERDPRDIKSTEKFVSYRRSRELKVTEKAAILEGIEKSKTNIHLPEVFPRYLTAYKRMLRPARQLNNYKCKDVFDKSAKESENYLNINLVMDSTTNNSIRWWKISEKRMHNIYNCSDPAPLDQMTDKLLLFIFNERVSDNIFGQLFSNYGILGMYAAYIFVAHRVLRAFYSDISYIIRCEELPHVDRILNLLNEIYLVRENKLFRLEEQLIAKLIYLYRSSETMIKWTRHKRSTLEDHMERQSVRRISAPSISANLEGDNNTNTVTLRTMPLTESSTK